jgi:hypothetical protein
MNIKIIVLALFLSSLFFTIANANDATDELPLGKELIEEMEKAGYTELTDEAIEKFCALKNDPKICRYLIVDKINQSNKIKLYVNSEDRKKSARIAARKAAESASKSANEVEELLEESETDTKTVIVFRRNSSGKLTIETVIRKKNPEVGNDKIILRDETPDHELINTPIVKSSTENEIDNTVACIRLFKPKMKGRGAFFYCWKNTVADRDVLTDETEGTNENSPHKKRSSDKTASLSSENSYKIVPYS